MLTRYRQNLNSFMDDVLNWHNDVMGSFDGWFKSPLANTGLNPLTTSFKETDTGLSYTLDVPGISKENLSITQGGSIVRVEGNRADRSQTISAQFSISSLANPDTLIAQLENGVLTLSFDRKEVSSKSDPKRIEVKEIKTKSLPSKEKDKE